MNYIEIAQTAARKAGEIQIENIGKIKNISFKEAKGKNNILTEVDTKSEEIIISTIKEKFPSHQILAEESGESIKNNSPYKWLIDPLDGTMNYSHAYPFFCVSIALELDGEIVCAVVYDPFKDEMFAAEEGKGAKLNGLAIHVSNAKLLKESLIVSGTFHHPDSEIMDKFISILKKLSITARGVRRDGSAALDLCYVACGRYDSFWEYGLNPWDMAAGALIVKEAGGSVTNLTGGEFTPYKGELISSNGFIHKEMIKILDF